jgi:microcystin-dependent protein
MSVSVGVASLEAVLDTIVPVGTVIAFAGVSVPDGWLLCNGAAISRSVYTRLFTAIDIAHGYGDNSTTFNLPDLRGRFLRGVAAGSVNDPDRASRTAANTGGNTGDAVGSVQADGFQSHAHISGMYALDSRFDVYASVGVSAGSSYGSTNGSSLSAVTSYPITDAASGGIGGTPRASTESRPKNVNVNYLIRI